MTYGVKQIALTEPERFSFTTPVQLIKVTKVTLYSINQCLFSDFLSCYHYLGQPPKGIDSKRAERDRVSSECSINVSSKSLISDQDINQTCHIQLEIPCFLASLRSLSAFRAAK